ncbi:hypothetical protein NW754_004045 [Fusarium falciforme]|nr:hypothetical protein NW754_004045 [Fusarium falciforme]KAJ4175687.1 hypothetical protein NW767_015701 [Fusarium falciforme]KAJ4245097.1 hypothetical protein NW757_010107 [Fusarium falciforme]
MKGYSVPLGVAYEKFAGVVAEKRGYRRALAIWSAIRAEANCKDTQSAFVKSLTKPQQQILACLLEWWNGETDPSRDVEIFITAINEHTCSPKGEDKLDLSDIALARDRPYGYHAKLAQAFASEFYDYPQGRPVPVHARRNNAGLIAACQRVSHLTAKTQSFPRSPSSLLNVLSPAASHGRVPDAILEPCSWLADSKKHGLPYYLWDIKAQRTVAVKDFPEAPAYTIISHTWGRWRVPSTQPNAEVAIPGVPWLVPRNTRFDIEALPDVLASRAAVFACTNFIWFDLFCIPQDRSAIAIAEIARQAAIFGAAERAVCWLNTIEDWRGLRASVQWLTLVYYSHSQREGEVKAKIDREISDLSEALKEPTELFGAFTQHDPENEAIAFGGNPCGWFTSLWTLQEVCLRPDMILLNKSWEPFRLFDDETALQVPLDTILALLKYVNQHIWDDTISLYPPAVTELQALVEATSLANILESDPLSILVVADHRRCERRRAEAIMSVVGATDWYLATPPELHEQNLILGRYPIEFLQEVRQREGARFFASLYGIVCCFWDIFRAEGRDDHQLGQTRIIDPSEIVADEVSTPNTNDERDWEDEEARGPEEMEVNLRVAGTMLPFDPRQSQSKFIGDTSGDGHSTIVTWTLDNNGAVLMHKVAIVASTDPGLDEGTDQALIAHVMGPSKKSPAKMEIQESTNLHDYLRNALLSLEDPAPKHAVPVLWREDGFVQGVILMEVGEPEAGDEQQRTYMGKLGDFFVLPGDHATAFREWDVDWVVL